MPNWCYNSLYVKGDTKELSKFIDKGKEYNENDIDMKSDLSMKNFLPIKGKWNSDSACDAWGTKWDIQANLHYEEDDGLACYDFDSAWSPPITFINRVSKLFKKLSFLLNYNEPGMNFSGSYQVQNGEVKQDDFLDSGGKGFFDEK
jgi:hypothetical protein